MGSETTTLTQFPISEPSRFPPGVVSAYRSPAQQPLEDAASPQDQIERVERCPHSWSLRTGEPNDREQSKLAIKRGQPKRHC